LLNPYFLPQWNHSLFSACKAKQCMSR
jgi:hypothetical protein